MATYKGNLSAALKQNYEPVPYPSLPYQDVPAFVASLRASDRMTAKLLRFVILCGIRANEGSRGRWGWFDAAAATYTIPASHMKGKVAHTVMLNAEALELLEELRRSAGGNPDPDAYIFPGKNAKHVVTRSISPLVPATATVHGFRTSLHALLSNHPDVAFETIKDILAHRVGSKTTQSYRREPSHPKMRAALKIWADFLA